MQEENKKTGLTVAETKVRNALIISIVLLAGIVATLFVSINWEKAGNNANTLVEEKKVVAPVVVEKPTPQTQPKITFTDITDSAYIDFKHVNGAYGERLMPETMGSGVAFLDYDNDGDQDLLLINSSYWEGHEGKELTRHALYANDGKGEFSDATEQAGLAFDDFGMGVAIGDYDGDGWIDIYITNLGRNRLLRNVNGKYVDTTESAGVAGDEKGWGSSATFLDYDKDGDLDLFVVNYVKWSRQDDLDIDFRLTGLGRAYGAPNHFIGTHNRLYRNEGNGTFKDVSYAAGIEVENESSVPVGKGMAVSPVDFNQDGWIDLIVANDTVRNFLYQNQGNGSFIEIGAFEGLAFDRNGMSTGAMGIDSAYYRNDIELGVAIGNFANEMSSLFVTVDGHSPFADEAMLEGLGPDTRLALTFGLFFFDVDLDGRLDLFQANGHLEHEINKVQPSQHYAQPTQLFWNCGDTCMERFRLIKDTGDLAKPMVGRGAAYADIDGDGDLDIAVLQNGRKARLFRNDQQSNNHWLRLKLIGKAPNLDALGATVSLTANGITQQRMVMPTRSYMSQVELPVTFGLGKTNKVDNLTISWPDGTKQEVLVPKVDTLMRIQQQ